VSTRKGGRQLEPRIVDPATHKRQVVGLRVAADFLGLNERTVRARIEEGKLKAVHDGNVYLITLPDLMAYDAARRRDSPVE
jgi:excisionase family DNA binding protein